MNYFRGSVIIMKAKQIRLLAGELVAILSSQAFLDRTGLSAQRVREIAGRDFWEPVFAQIFPIRCWKSVRSR